MPTQQPTLDPLHERVYLWEVEAQCSHASAAIRQVDATMDQLRSVMRGEVAMDSESRRALLKEVFRNLHSFLTHASNASRLLFPVKSGDRNRGAYLRERLDIPQGSPLQSRALRDHLEHFDERLDAWRSKSRSFISDNIGPRQGSMAGIDLNGALRWYDPTTRTFWFLEESFDIDALAKCVASLQVKARALSDPLLPASSAGVSRNPP